VVKLKKIVKLLVSNFLINFCPSLHILVAHLLYLHEYYTIL